MRRKKLWRCTRAYDCPDDRALHCPWYYGVSANCIPYLEKRERSTSTTVGVFWCRFKPEYNDGEINPKGAEEWEENCCLWSHRDMITARRMQDNG